MANLCCGASAARSRGSFSGSGETGDVLLLGMEGSGKTLLARNLAALCAKIPTSITVDTVATIGTEVYDVPAPKGVPFKFVFVREVGGAMLPLWPQYYNGVCALIYCIDGCDAAALAPATLELYDLLADARLARCPVALVLTKQDLPQRLAPAELDTAMGLADMARQHPGRLWVVSLSSLPPGATATAGAAAGSVSGAPPGPVDYTPELQALLVWMVETKAQSMGLEVHVATGGGGAGGRPRTSSAAAAAVPVGR